MVGNRFLLGGDRECIRGDAINFGLRLKCSWCYSWRANVMKSEMGILLCMRSKHVVDASGYSSVMRMMRSNELDARKKMSLCSMLL